MAVTRIYSTLIFIIAAVVALLLGFCPKFGALIGTLPIGVLGGLAIELFGLIAATGGRIWVENRVDFSRSRNLITAAVALTIGAGMVGNIGITFGSFTIGGIGVATFGSIILYQVLRERKPEAEEAVSADSAVGLNPAKEPRVEGTD
jgi:putative pyrimidine permease RutG